MAILDVHLYSKTGVTAEALQTELKLHNYETIRKIYLKILFCSSIAKDKIIFEI